ncbi:MAG TPA: Uma2 family endonuclease [Nostocaceae cyanobacterium]|nr:Uma2 family endonuclease [Nostocaceae cyanobacterium]
MLKYDPRACMPSSEELPNSDDTPVDDELQHLIPNLLRETLAIAWANRLDWFFARRMGIYHDPNQPPIVPSAFLSLGVERFYDENLRSSYVLWEEQKLPILALEVVSKIYRQEYCAKKDKYAYLEILYYVIYNPHRHRKLKLEIYKLIDGVYYLQDGNPVWLPEIGLGIGIERGTYQGITREWLYWYNEQGQKLLTPEEQAKQAQERANRLAEQLKALGIDPNTIV